MKSDIIINQYIVILPGGGRMNISTIDDIVSAKASSFGISRVVGKKLVDFFDEEDASNKEYNLMRFASKAVKRLIAENPKDNDFTLYIRFLTAFVKERKIFRRKQKKILKKEKKRISLNHAIETATPLQKAVQQNLFGDEIYLPNKPRYMDQH